MSPGRVAQPFSFLDGASRIRLAQLGIDPEHSLRMLLTECVGRERAGELMFADEERMPLSPGWQEAA